MRRPTIISVEHRPRSCLYCARNAGEGAPPLAPPGLFAREANHTIVKKRVLINVEDKDIRVAVLEDNELCQLFVEQLDDKSIVGNVYKGLVEGIVPGLQAAFINIGLERNAFLHFSDIVGNYILPGKGLSRPPARRGHSRPHASGAEAPPPEGEEDGETAPEKPVAHKAVPLKSGDEVLVQVVKEPISSKGARVTANISLPGRYLVFLPFSDGSAGGVSRRIEDVGERKRLKALLRSLSAEAGNFIVRTAGLDQDEEEISADVKKLQVTWDEIRESAEKCHAPALAYDDHDILGRLVRDELTVDVEQLIIDSRPHADRLRQILAGMMPGLKQKVLLYTDLNENLFEHYDVENQYQKALRQRVWLKSGGYLIVEETEALVVIDVNSGKFVGKNDQEAMILQLNLEAAEAVTRQLRLRDVGGIIVTDFIDMRSHENQRTLMKRFKELLKKDRAKTTVCQISELGILEMTRKRVRQSLSKVVFRQCPYCQGLGRVLTEQQIWKNIKYEVLAKFGTNAETPEAKRSLRVTVHPAIRTYLEQEVLDAARSLATRCQASLRFEENKEFHLEQYEVVQL